MFPKYHSAQVPRRLICVAPQIEHHILADSGLSNKISMMSVQIWYYTYLLNLHHCLVLRMSNASCKHALFWLAWDWVYRIHHPFCNQLLPLFKRMCEKKCLVSH